MEEITLSVMRNTDETEPVLRQLLEEFERTRAIRVRLQMLDWTTARHEIKNFAIHQRGPDVSAMATTWVADLVSMNTLQPIIRPQGDPMGRQEEFIEASWQTAGSGEEKRIFAAPWLVDTYVMHYRQDLLEKAGIDGRTAFQSLECIDGTIRRLSEAGVLVPIQLPYVYDRFCVMHTMAAWVWSHGGAFCSDDGKQVLIDQPEAMVGIQEYFKLASYLTPAMRARVSQPDAPHLFRQGEAATAFGTRSFIYSRSQLAPEVQNQWRAASLPQPHFVGGVNLVMWKHSLHEAASLELIRYLNEPDVVDQCAEAMLTSPARLSVLESARYLEDPILRVISESARTGRPYAPVRLWGLIEDRVTEAIGAIGNKLLNTPDAFDEAFIAKTMTSAARRLNLTLGA